jgi:Flp pilus assembly protein TadG
VMETAETSSVQRGVAHSGPMTVFCSSEGAQLLEFAMVLPMMLLLLLGVIDFVSALTLQQKLNNAAREGARFAITETCSDCTQAASSTQPISTHSVLNDVLTYMTNTGINVCGLTSASVPTSPDPSDSSDPYSWVFSSSCTDTGGTLSIRIDRGTTFVDSAGNTVEATRIVISRPYKWSGITAPLVGASNHVTTIASYAIMEN